jgi:hypothetical protein
VRSQLLLLWHDSVAVAWGLAGDEDANRLWTSIDRLMPLAGGDFEALTGLKDKVLMFYFEGQLSFEHKEELASVYVGVAGFAGVGRHELFDDAELRRFDEMPTVAVGSLRASPFVVFGGLCADDL